nr:MAG: hypothetical protein 2 [Yunnan farmland cysto-like virus]
MSEQSQQRLLIQAGALKTNVLTNAAAQQGELKVLPKKLEIPVSGSILQLDTVKLLKQAGELLKHLTEGGAVTPDDIYGLEPVIHWSKDGSGYLRTVRLYHSPLAVDWPHQSIFPGLTIVLGETGAGKTEFIRGRLGTDVIVRFGEPYEDVDMEHRVLHTSSFESTIQAALLLALTGANVAIDSLRLLVYSLEGAAMEGGMVAGLFDVVTALNNTFANFGVGAVVALNPMMADETKISRLQQRLAASCSGSILLSKGQIIESSLRMVGGRGGFMQETETESRFTRFGDVDSTGPVETRTMLMHRGSELPERLGHAYGELPNEDSDLDEDHPRPGVNFTL